MFNVLKLFTFYSECFLHHVYREASPSSHSDMESPAAAAKAATGKLSLRLMHRLLDATFRPNRAEVNRFAEY